MKKLFALAICLAMLVFCLAGCDALLGLNEYEQALIGSWTWEIDLSAAYAEGLLADPDFAPFVQIEGSTVKIVYTFNEDGTYAISADKDAADAAYTELRNDLIATYTAYLDDLALNSGLTVDEILSESGFASIEAVADSDLADYGYEEMIDSFTESGNFEAEADRILFSAGLEYAVDPEMYEKYTISGNTLTLTGFMDKGVEDTDGYPITLNKN